MNSSFERGLLLNLLSVLLNASATTVSKFALIGMNSIVTTLIICASSALFSLIYILKDRTPITSEFKQLLPIAAMNAAAMIMLYSSIAILDPVTVGMIGRFYVVFTTVLSVFILKETMTRNELVLIGLAIAGTFLFVKSDKAVDLTRYLGIGLALGYTFLFALANMFVKKSIVKTSSVTILFYNNVFAVFACLGILIVQGYPLGSLSAVSKVTWAYAILTSAMTFAGLVLFFNSFRFLSFKLSNIIRSSSPLFVVAVSWPFFPLNLSPMNIAGGGLVLFSIVFLSLGEKKKRVAVVEKSKTDIYEDASFFGQYLDSTSEKDYFAKLLSRSVAGNEIKNILDLGCFDGTLTCKIVREINQSGSAIQTVTAVEPSAAPLADFAERVKAVEFSSVDWSLKNQTMESYLASTEQRFDLLVASHSLYWIGDNNLIVRQIATRSKNWAIVIRDSGMLHELESKFRPRMTNKSKRFISTKEIVEALEPLNLQFRTHHFEASMQVPSLGTPEFKSLVGFLLDLQLSEIDDRLLPEIYSDLSVVNGRSSYGIDVIWNIEP